jgi:hypothetical protein
MSKIESENIEEIVRPKNPLPGYSTNKPVYLVQIKDSSTKTQKYEFWVSFKVSYKPTVLQLLGWKVPSKATVNNLQDAEDKAEREQYFDIAFPWHKVESIKNITFNK